MSEAPLPFSEASNPAPNGATLRNLTHMLVDAGAGTALRNELFQAVYGELRAIAARKMASERPGHTLQPTALVHEAWLKFGGRTFANRAHFFAAAAEAMRHILVDGARRRAQLKRGGAFEQIELFEYAIAAPLDDEKLLMVNEALETVNTDQNQLLYWLAYREARALSCSFRF